MFKLNANPTFKAKVEVPVPGDKPQTITMEFRHRTSSGIRAWLDSPETQAKSNIDFLADFVVGWSDVDEPFSREALEKLTENFMGAAPAIRETYLQELSGARLGN